MGEYDRVSEIGSVEAREAIEGWLESEFLTPESLIWPSYFGLVILETGDLGVNFHHVVENQGDMAEAWEAAKKTNVYLILYGL